MCKKFLGTWKLVSSENFDEYMKALEHCNLGERLTESRTEMGWQRDNNKEKVSGRKNGCGKSVFTSEYRRMLFT
ncbi:myelin P2 protein isoform X2 [Loxodonta africana]|uniref:myelin P2 protein isoform X2 n=1 Tax=Loxodonta africana TaxID=9785 RepID=UPI0030D10CE7